MNQKWYKSWAMWQSLAALIVYVAKTIFHVDIADWVNGLMDIILLLMVGFGIVNNPNVSNRWVLTGDDGNELNG